MPVPEPVPLPGMEITVNPLDHEGLDVAIAKRRDADLDGASYRGVGHGHGLGLEVEH